MIVDGEAVGVIVGHVSSLDACFVDIKVSEVDDDDDAMGDEVCTQKNVRYDPYDRLPYYW